MTLIDRKQNGKHILSARGFVNFAGSGVIIKTLPTMRYANSTKSHFVYPLGFAFSYDPTGRESRAKDGQADNTPQPSA